MARNWTMLPLMDYDRWKKIDGEKWGGREKGSGIMEGQTEKMGGGGEGRKGGWKGNESLLT